MRGGNITHGDTANGKEFRLSGIWKSMKSRSLNTNRPKYHRYGGRGINVCREWLEYLPFKTWAMANGYSRGLTIDRVDNDKGYNPENCEWITSQENTAKINPESKRKLTFQDAEAIRESELSQSELARRYGINQSNIWNIIHGITYKKDYNNGNVRT